MTIGKSIYRLAVLIAVTVACSPHSNAMFRNALRDSIQDKLAVAATAVDSIKLYYDLLDISTNARQHYYCDTLVDLGLRSGADSVVLDALRLNLNYLRINDSAMVASIDLVKTLPPGDDRDETEVFLTVNRMSRISKKASADEKESTIKELIANYATHEQGGIFDQVRDLYTLCIWVGDTSTDMLYFEYMNRLKDLLDQLPPSRSNALKNMFYTQLATVATSYGRNRQAVEADSMLLEIIEGLKKRYKAQGRIHRDYSRNDYISRSRMLANYKALSPQQVEECYNSILADVLVNSDVKYHMATYERPVLFYLMATGDYRKAMKLLRSHSDMADDKVYGIPYLDALVDAARETNDQNSLIEALDMYNARLRDELETTTDGSMGHVRMLYDINSLRATNDRLLADMATADRLSHNRLVALLAVIAGCLLLGVGVALYMNLRQRRLMRRDARNADRLAQCEAELATTRTELEIAHTRAAKVDDLINRFLRNVHDQIIEPLGDIAGFSQLIADIVPDSERGRLEEYVRIITDNNAIVESIVNNLLEASQLETNTLAVNRRQVNLSEICRRVAEEARLHASRPEDIAVELPPTPLVITSDPLRVERVLENLVDNALKFAPGGRVTIGYSVDPADMRVTLRVSDHGPGIPTVSQETIFDRFIKLNPTSQGVGLGLYVARMTARLLKGSLRVDPSYNGGASFVFVLPLK